MINPEAKSVLKKSSKKLHDANKKVASFLSSVTESVYNQLHYDALTNIYNGVLDESVDIGEHAIEKGTVHAIGKYLNWDVGRAIEFAADILHDVNAHKLADELRIKNKKECVV